MSLSEYCRKGLLRAVIVAVLFSVVAKGIEAFVQPNGVWLFGAVVVMQVFAFGGITLLLGLTGTERRWIREYVQRNLSFGSRRRDQQFNHQRTEADLALSPDSR
jgi:uncharacterized membrane protein YjgN (DUF898 family)